MGLWRGFRGTYLFHIITENINNFHHEEHVRRPTAGSSASSREMMAEDRGWVVGRAGWQTLRVALCYSRGGGGREEEGGLIKLLLLRTGIRAP